MRYFFEDYSFDTEKRELRRRSEIVPTTPQVFDLLEYLIRNRDRVVSKDDLVTSIWNGRAISDAALTTRLNAARTAIGDSGGEQRLIKTLPRKGLRFVGSVSEVPEPIYGAVTDGSVESPEASLALPDKPSLAVLPFANLSLDPDQDYFADGMVEDIITGLSRSKSLFVIARQSTFTYKGKATDVQKVGRELGVRYVLEGSVRKEGNRVRISGQLIDATTGLHLWADRFDSQLEDVFDLQDRVACSVIGAISPRVERAEIERAKRKPTESLTAYDYYLRALSCNYRNTRAGNDEGLKLIKVASSIDPEFAATYALGANLHAQRKACGWSIDPALERAEASQLANRAIELDRDDPLVLAMVGDALAYVLGKVEEGTDLILRAIELDPNHANARLWGGWAHLWLGDGDAAVQQFQDMLRLSPLDPRAYSAHSGLGFAHFFAGRHDDALASATIAIRLQPSFLGAHYIRTASHAMSGRLEDAQAACAALMQLSPALCVSLIERRPRPFRKADVEKLTQAFRIAGMPD
ncbi:adenylate cyclase 3 [Bradyrhizobium guangdongense]|uniref:winged helix-turn-helix domain-containing tetratricopeptide repeat protein n=1 Tax=Bradyrhizobium guangdongense TaxID=1325090 RepID=UPI00112BC1A1|nr:winged helix-turn-helix domain-containing tetratricopeptide repeat protein [Bradyrhizobium guangdongense]TPQ41829.1 adenylate cyclase 3 [Bradyrhizobium guangdongense]